jgi:hypothetical protein
MPLVLFLALCSFAGLLLTTVAVVLTWRARRLEIGSARHSDGHSASDFPGRHNNSRL